MTVADNSSVPVVLIVEDHAMSRKLLRDVMEMRFDVLVAGSAEESQELLRQQQPDLILLDMQLPEMDGFTFTRQLKDNPATAAIPVVAVSAHSMPENIETALAAGCLEYITKPITEDPMSLVERMAELVNVASC